MFDHRNPLYRLYEEVINQKRLDVIDELYAPHYVNRIAPFGLKSDVAGVKELFTVQAKAFPDWHITADDVIEVGNKYIVRWTLTGTRRGDYFGIKPTGKKFKMVGVDIETIVDGKIVEHDGAEDMLGLLQQIGAVPRFLSMGVDERRSAFRDHAEASVKQALLVIDVQNEYFTGKMPISYPPRSLDHVLRAMDAATENGIPVIIVQHAALQAGSSVFVKGSDGWELHPEVEKRPKSVVIEKCLPGSFTETNLDSWLKQNGVHTVVIAGYMTQMCCDTTARQAMHLGYAVSFLSDATGTLALQNDVGAVSAEDLHRTILAVQQSRFGKVMTTGSWINTLGAR